jgi:hypothetical protein
MPVSEMLSDEAREYLALRHKEELMKIRIRVVERKAALACEEVRKKEEATATRELAAREEEIEAALARHPPPPGGAPRHDGAGPQTQPSRSAPTPAPRSGSAAPTASAAASPTAPVRPLHPASLVNALQF